MALFAGCHGKKGGVWWGVGGCRLGKGGCRLGKGGCGGVWMGMDGFGWVWMGLDGWVHKGKAGCGWVCARGSSLRVKFFFYDSKKAWTQARFNITYKLYTSIFENKQFSFNHQQ